MTTDGPVRSTMIPHGIFLPTERADFDIQWDDVGNWQRRHEKVIGTTAEVPLGMLALYWKYSWSTARSPWLMSEMFEAVVKKSGAAEKFWRLLIGDGKVMYPSCEFIIGTQYLAYSGFYFAYESFLVSCCEAKTGRKLPDAMGWKKIKAEIEKAFSTTLEQQVWSHPDVERIRRVRNDLVHRSGTPKTMTAKMAEDIVIEGHLQITPNDIKEEMETLTAKIDVMVDQEFPSAGLGT